MEQNYSPNDFALGEFRFPDFTKNAFVPVYRTFKKPTTIGPREDKDSEPQAIKSEQWKEVVEAMQLTSSCIDLGFILCLHYKITTRKALISTNASRSALIPPTWSTVTTGVVLTTVSYDHSC